MVAGNSLQASAWIVVCSRLRDGNQAPTVPKKILARCGMPRHAAACRGTLRHAAARCGMLRHAAA